MGESYSRKTTGYEVSKAMREEHQGGPGYQIGRESEKNAIDVWSHDNQADRPYYAQDLDAVS